jgi:hypothetical protein
MTDYHFNVNCARCAHWESARKTYGVCNKYERQSMAWDTCQDWEAKE